MSEELKKLSDEEILTRFKNQDEWELRELILLAYGYEYQGFDWKAVEKTNGFPYRNYTNALKATTPQAGPKERLLYTEKFVGHDAKSVCNVKKRDFYEWAHKQWKKHPEIAHTYKLYLQYKDTLKTPIKKNVIERREIMDQLQVSDFVRHCKLGNSAESYNADLKALSFQAALNDKRWAPESYRRASKRLPILKLLEIAQHGKP